MLSSHGCCVRRYTIHHQYQYTIAKYTIRIGSTLPKYTLLESTWYLVSLVEAEPDTKWVDRGLIRLHLDTECYRRTAAVCVDTRYTISTSSPSIPYDLAHLYLPKYVPYLNVPGTWYLVEAEPDTKWVDRG